MKKFLLRAALLVLAGVLSFLLLLTGKGHTLLLDNKSIEMGGKTFGPTGSVTVTVDSGKPITLASGERDLVVVKGPNHSVKVASGDGTVEKKFSLPFKDMFILSMPALLEGSDKWFEVKRPEPAKPASDSNDEVPVAGETIPL